jgi:UrcA family protein
MSISTVFTRRLIRKATLSAASLTTLGAFGAAAMAQQPSLPSPAADTLKVSLSAQATRVADVSLADLNLSTPDGMRVARERLHAMAQRICAARTDNRGVSSQPSFVVCVDNTVAGALGNIGKLQTNATVRNSVTRAANVSVADLDLSTPEGSRVARERLEAMARRLCAELALSKDLSYRPNWAACVNDTIVGALAQAKVLAAEKETRTARRLAP